MFLLQLALSALVWAGTVLGLVRRREETLDRAKRTARGRRAMIAAACLVGSVMVLAFGMGALALGGLTSAGLTWWGWPLITLVGSAFVVLQTLGLVPLVLNAVTREPDGSSDRLDLDHP